MKEILSNMDKNGPLNLNWCSLFLFFNLFVRGGGVKVGNEQPHVVKPCKTTILKRAMLVLGRVFATNPTGSYQRRFQKTKMRFLVLRPKLDGITLEVLYVSCSYRSMLVSQSETTSRMLSTQDRRVVLSSFIASRKVFEQRRLNMFGC